MADAQVLYEIQLALQRYSRDIRQATKDASALDHMLAAVQKQARKTQAALNALEGKIKIDVDVSGLNKAESALKSMAGMSPDVSVQVDTSQIMGAEIDLRSLDNFSPRVEVQVSANEEQVQSELNSLVAPDLRVSVTADEEQAQSELNSLTAPTISVDVDADTTKADTRIDNVGRRSPSIEAVVDADTSRAESAIDDLRNQPPIQLTFDVSNLPGVVSGIFGTAAAPFAGIVGGAQELDAALKELQATTGKAIPGAEQLIEDVYSAGNWGATRDEVAGVIAELSKFEFAQDDLGGAAVVAFQTMQTTGEDFTSTLDAMRSLVTNGLVPDVEGAGDFIVTLFQRGGDVAGDAMDTITEYSSHFAQAGVTGAAAMDLIIQGLQAGTRDGDKLADTFKEMGIKIEEALGGAAIGVDTGSAIEPLRRLGLMDEAEAFEAGTLTGEAFMGAVIAAAKEKGTDQDIFDILGTPAEDFGIDILKGLDFGAAGQSIIPEGAAEEAATLLNDNIGAAFQNLGRVMQTEVIDRLKDTGIDINAFLQSATDKLYEIASLISSGVALPDALEIALEAPGLANTIRDFESFFGNAVIELLTGFRNLATTLFPDVDVSGMNEAITSLAGKQLAFDLQIADTEAELAGAVERAMSRGVTLGAASDAANTAVQEMIESGNIAGARALASELSQQQVTVELTTVGGLLNQDKKVPLSFTADMNMTQEEIIAQAEELARQYATATGEAVHGIVVDVTELDLEASDAALQGAVDILNAQVNEKLAGGQTLSAIQQLAQAGFTTDAATIAKEAIGGIADSFLGLLQPAEDAVEPLNNIDATNLAAAALAAGDMAAAFQVAQDAGWPITEEQLGLIGQAGTDFFTLQTKLTEYTLGLEDAKTDGTAALETLKTAGIDVVIDAQDDMLDGMDAYVLGVQGGLEIAKVSWQDYIDWLASNGLTIDTVITPPTVPTEGGLAAGGRASGWTMVGERGPELAYFGQGADILNNQTSSALMSLIGQLSGGGSTVNNYINVNVLQNNNSIAAGNASAGVLSAQLRGFAS